MLPPCNQINKDFLKKLLIDEKRVFKMVDVNLIKVQRLDEISIKKMMENIKDDAELAKYLPDEYLSGRAIDRTFFFNVINTVYPGYLHSAIDHANMQRNNKTNDEG